MVHALRRDGRGHEDTVGVAGMALVLSVQDSPPNLALSHLCCLLGAEPVMHCLSAILTFSLGRAVCFASLGNPGTNECGCSVAN